MRPLSHVFEGLRQGMLGFCEVYIDQPVKKLHTARVRLLIVGGEH